MEYIYNDYITIIDSKWDYTEIPKFYESNTSL